MAIRGRQRETDEDGQLADGKARRVQSMKRYADESLLAERHHLGQAAIHAGDSRKRRQSGGKRRSQAARDPLCDSCTNNDNVDVARPVSVGRRAGKCPGDAEQCRRDGDRSSESSRRQQRARLATQDVLGDDFEEHHAFFASNGQANGGQALPNRQIVHQFRDVKVM